jgi:hypothetical protein
MLNALKLFAFVYVTLVAFNLVLELFVMAVDVTTLGAGRSKYSSDVRALLTVADRGYPFAEQILSLQRHIQGLFGLQKFYYWSWILTVLIEASIVVLVVYFAYGCSVWIRSNRSGITS